MPFVMLEEEVLVVSERCWGFDNPKPATEDPPIAPSWEFSLVAGGQNSQQKAPGGSPGAIAILGLATKAEALNQLTVALDVYVLKVAE